MATAKLIELSFNSVMAGITDSYELYKFSDGWNYQSTSTFIPVKWGGTPLGSGMDGMSSLLKMFRDRREEKDVQKDILQETFINTVAGWCRLAVPSRSQLVLVQLHCNVLKLHATPFSAKRLR